MDNLPIHMAIQNVIELFGFESEVSIISNNNGFNNGKIWCIVDDGNDKTSFLEYISSENNESLAPILIISLVEENSPFTIFKKLSDRKKVAYMASFDIVDFIKDIKSLESNGKWDNPFQNISALKRTLKINEWDLKDIYTEISKVAMEGENRLKRFHGISSEEENMRKHVFIECCLENIYALLEKGKWTCKKVLWIENKPDDVKVLKDINDNTIKSFLKKYFNYKFEIKQTSDDIKSCYKELQNHSKDYEKYDLILIDIFLGEDEKRSGKDFLHVLTHNYPHIPAFILSASEDLETISETIKEGADFYILKKYAASIPHYFRKFYEKIGKIVLLINDNELRRNIVGNIRMWQFDKETLWFGDKCFHMINHTYNHAENDWKLMNQIFPMFHDKFSFKAEDIYCLCMATWLHDIGHVGNEKYGEPHNVRDTHSIISAELILKHPEYYRIFGFEENDKSPYRYATFSRPKIILQHIRERVSSFNVALVLLENNDSNKSNNIDKNLRRQMILEEIALMCIYHSSKFPLDEDDIKRITEKRNLSIECYENLDRKTEPIHLASICSLMKNVTIIKLTAILRFIDSLDHNKNRVGNETTRSIKTETIKRDLRCQLAKLEKVVDLLINFPNVGQEKAKRFRNLFFEQVEQNVIEKNDVPKKLKQEQRSFIDNYEKMIDTTNYDLLLEYIQFICVQDGHFNLHNSIEVINLETSSNDKDKILLDIKIKTLRQEEDLKKIMIKNWDEEKAKSFKEYMLGIRNKVGVLEKKEDGEFKDEGYIGKELRAARKYIEEFVDIDNHKAEIGRAHV